MNHSLAIALVTDDVSFVGIRFKKNDGASSAVEYTYKTLDKTLKVGDVVVVPSNETYLYSVGFVTSIDPEVDYNSTITYKWVVQKIDLSTYERTLKEEQRVIDEVKTVERKHRRAALREALLKENVETFQSITFFNPAVVQEQEVIDNGGDVTE